MTKYESLNLVRLNNKLAAMHPDQVKPVKSFKSRDEARAVVSTAMQITGERLIRVLKPEVVRRGLAGERLARYSDGMFTGELTRAFEEAHDNPAAVAGDIRYNEKARIIKTYV